MIAISIPNRTIYDCNPFQKGPNMIAMIENLFPHDSSNNHSHVTLTRFPRLQSYLVLFERDCNHIWSDSELRLQSYLVPLVTNIAIIFGHFAINIAIIFSPYFYCHCNHKWSSPIKIDSKLQGWTKYGCNHFHNTDQLCLQSWSPKGLNKLAIMMTMRT